MTDDDDDDYGYDVVLCIVSGVVLYDLGIYTFL